MFRNSSNFASSSSAGRARGLWNREAQPGSRGVEKTKGDSKKLQYTSAKKAKRKKKEHMQQEEQRDEKETRSAQKRDSDARE
jgi:hypothetical protein